MTNEQIIFNERMRLMEVGALAGTGQFIEVEDTDGKKTKIEEPEEIHTFEAWKERGFTVKRGEHAITKLTIWKHTVKKAKTDEEKDREKMFMKTAAFFSPAQVKPSDK